MCRMIILVAAFSIGFLASRLLDGLVVQAEGGGQGEGTPVANGDVNADGEIDISDAMYLLESLFMGGPDIVPIECPSAGGGLLPATGETLCYDDAGNEIDCDSADYPGQDGAYQAGCPSEGRFVDNGDGTVTDTCTGLMWQKDTADVDGSGSVGGEDRLTWQEALQYCDDLSFAGYDDWRLPNVRELQSILDYGRFDPAVDPVFDARGDWHWSATTIVSAPVRAWTVHFLAGLVTYSELGKAPSIFVRAVRGGL